jgi:hypothetical protein
MHETAHAARTALRRQEVQFIGIGRWPERSGVRQNPSFREDNDKSDQPKNQK